MKIGRLFAAAICGTMSLLPIVGRADTFYTINNTTADAFLAAGSPINPVGTNLAGLNFGSAGSLAIAPASSTKGEFDSVVKFNLAGAVSQFNTTYGAGNWRITGLALSLASNVGTQGAQPGNNIFNTINAGSFGIDWLADDSWVEGTGSGNGMTGYPNNSFVSFNSIPNLFSAGYDSLGTFTYTPPGNNVYVNYALPLNADLVNDATAGGNVTLYFYAADNQIGYVFNSKEFNSNHPELTVTAGPVPEPGAAALMTLSLGGFLMLRRQQTKK